MIRTRGEDLDRPASRNPEGSEISEGPDADASARDLSAKRGTRKKHATIPAGTPESPRDDRTPAAAARKARKGSAPSPRVRSGIRRASRANRDGLGDLVAVVQKKRRQHTRFGVSGRFALLGEYGIYHLFVARRGEKTSRQIGSAIDLEQAKPWLQGDRRTAPRTIEIHHESTQRTPRGLWNR